MADLAPNTWIDQPDTDAISGSQEDPDDRFELEQGTEQFIEGMGLYFERLSIPRIGGRILGLLMLAQRPLTLDDMARVLRVSRASVSTNARLSVAVGMVEHLSLPGDRRDYYAFSADAWTRRIEVVVPLLEQMRRIAEQGLAAVNPENVVGRDRLHMAIEFCDFYRRETEQSVARWERYLEARDEEAKQ